MNENLDVLCGLSLDGARLTEIEDLAVGQAAIGRVVFGPSALLRDLELRLGIAHVDVSHSFRIARWSARLAEVATKDRFYSKSYAVDAWGTAAEVLRMRDTLIEAGWNSAKIKGDRLEQLAELEALTNPPLPPGIGDRLRMIAAALAAGSNPGYTRLRTADPTTLWSHRWQLVFGALAQLGCKVETLETQLPMAAAATDLGRMQRHILDGGKDPMRPTGDGSLMLLRGETVWETACATAGLLHAWGDGNSAVVIRSGETLPFDLALERAGLATQGVHSAGRLRPFLQVLPLALELVFEPKDPHRILELLALPKGPFRRDVANKLAGALSKMPGLGSEAWLEAKAESATQIREQMEAKGEGAQADAAIEEIMLRVSEWIESPGHPQSAAPRAALIAVLQRVKKWLQGRLIHDQDEQDRALIGAAYAQAAALEETLTADPRVTLSLLQVKQLVEAVAGSGGVVALRREQVGRVDHVDCAAALLRPRGTVVWWNCAASVAESPRQLQLSTAERKALSASGVHLNDARAEMSATAAAWRRAVLLATERLVLVAPTADPSGPVAVHPLWDELIARMGSETRDIARVSLSASQVLHNTSPLVKAKVATQEEPEAILPGGRAEWRIAAKHLERGDRASASSIEVLLGCPLRWVLHYRAGLRAGNLVSLPESFMLYGTLGHRLVELMHENGGFALKGPALRARIEETFDAILPKEGATLLLAGKRDELAQVRHKLTVAIVQLADLLAQSQLEIVDVEKEESVAWRGRALEGRLDMVLRNRAKEDVVLDLKWGGTGYEKKLKDGAAVQLAVYAMLRKQSSKAFPPVAYFSLSRGEALATDAATFIGAKVTNGENAESTWKRTETTLSHIETRLDTGNVPVAGLRASLPVMQACGEEPDAQKHLVLPPEAACEYCEHDPICGRRWEESLL